MGLIEDFIARYSREYDYYDQVARLVAQALDAHLQAAGIRSLVTSRAKSPIRLDAKVRQRTERKKYETVEDIYSDIVDLAGVRVALYFPGERDQVDASIKQLFVLSEPPKEFPAQSKPTYTKRFSGYWANHYRVQLKASTLTNAQQRYADARVEIQVASVLMHAWSEVEHDLVYKPYAGTLSMEEYAILDELNGLVMAGEIALERLQRAGEARVAASGRKFENHFDLAAHLLGIIKPIQNVPADSALGRVDLLFELLKKINLLTPEQLKPYTDVLHNDFEARPLAEQIIDLLLIEDDARYSLYEEIRAARPSLVRAEDIHSPEVTESEAALGQFLSAWIGLEQVMRDLTRKMGLPHLPINKMQEALGMAADEEFKYLKRLRNIIVHGLEVPDIDDVLYGTFLLRDLTDQLRARSAMLTPTGISLD